MSTTELARGAFAFVFAIGCTGLDPDAFGARGAPPNEPGAGGLVVRRGSLPDAGGCGSTTTHGPSGIGWKRPRPGWRPDGEGGDGSADEGGAAGAPDERGLAAAARRGRFFVGQSRSRRDPRGRSGRHARGRRAGRRSAAGRAGAGGRADVGAAGGGRGGAPASHALVFQRVRRGLVELQGARNPGARGRARSPVAGSSRTSTARAAAPASRSTARSRREVSPPCARPRSRHSSASRAQRATNLTFNGDDARRARMRRARRST